MFDPRSAITRLSLALLLGSPIQASAEDSGLPDTGIKLGPVQSFGNEGAARAACKPDGVVWADRSTGFYYPRFAPEYGSTPTGVFTCYKQAAKADYWSFGAGGLIPSHGKIFPFTLPTCNFMRDPKGHWRCLEPGA